MTGTLQEQPAARRRAWPRRRRVAPMFQMTAVECGAACLAMVLGYHQHHVSVQECRNACGGGRDGVTAGDIARAGRQYGLDVRGYPLPDTPLAEVELPAIVHWEGNHFVVLERYSEQGVTIVDPARGRLRLSLEEFGKRAGGVVLELVPGPAFSHRRRDRSAVWSHVRPLVDAPGTVSLVTQVAAASLLLAGLGMAIPLVLKVVLDTVVQLEEAGPGLLLALGAVVLALAQLTSSYLRSALLVRLQGRLDWHALMRFFVHLLRLPALFFHHRTTGDVLMRAGSIAMLRELLANQTVASIADAVLMVAYLLVLLWISPSMAVVVGGLALLAVGLLLATTRAVHESMARELGAQAEAHGHVVETLTGIPTVKAMAGERRVVDHLDTLVLDWMQAAVRRNHLAGIIGATASTLRVLGPVAVLLLGMVQVQAGAMTPGVMVAAAWLAMAGLAPVYTLAANGQRLQLAGAQLRRIVDVLETEVEDERPSAPRVRLRGEIEVRDLEFSYQERGAPVLADISLHVPAGARLALVGSTGAGKSTLGMLLLGLFPPRRGEILFDGVPIGAMNLRTLREQFGVVLQDPWVFRGTIRENLTLGDSRYSPQELMWAAGVAGLLEDIQGLPMGPDTLVGERGTGLSGGQQQRLAIARAVLRRPVVLLLDEATSHLDAVTEARISQRLSELECTQVVIAHRLSTVRGADLIVVLDRGRIVETGRHEELLEHGGQYAALVRGQLEQDQSVG